MRKLLLSTVAIGLALVIGGTSPGRSQRMRVSLCSLPMLREWLRFWGPVEFVL